MTRLALPLAALLCLTAAGGCGRTPDETANITAAPANDEAMVEDVSPDGLAAPDNMTLESESDGAAANSAGPI